MKSAMKLKYHPYLKHLRISTLLYCLCTGLTLSSCRSRSLASLRFPAYFKEGHRGARGLMPENTIPAMKAGLRSGANTLEMDIYLSRDGKVVVAHDPYINPDFSYLPSRAEIPVGDAHKYLLHQLTYDEIKTFDVGSKYYKAFPHQLKMEAHIPVLGDLIDSLENYAAAAHLPKPIYNIELKNKPEYDGSFNAGPETLAEALIKVLRSKSIGKRFYVQSFDLRPLQYIHQHYPSLTIGFLTDSKLSFEENIKALGFYPQIYSPHYKMVTPELISKCHQRQLKIVPWTVDNPADIRAMTDMGVDGIITDYPNYLAPSQQ